MGINLKEIREQQYNNSYKKVGSLNIAKPQQKKSWHNELLKYAKGYTNENPTIYDVPLIIGSTVADLGLNAAKGVMNVGDSAARAVSGLIAEATNSDRIRNNLATKKNPLISGTNKIINKIDNHSLSGDTLDKVAESVGYTGGLAAAGDVLGPAANIPIGKLKMPTLAAIGGVGSGFTEAYQKSAKGAQAWTKALGSGAIEGITEGLFGMFGVGGNEITDQWGKQLASKFKSGIAKTLAKTGVSATGEAVEEFLSYAGNQGLDWLIDKATSQDDPKFYEHWNWDEVGQEMAIAFISAGLSQGGNTAVNINQEYNNVVNEEEKRLGRNLTAEEKNSIKESVIDAIINEDNNINNESDNNIAENLQIELEELNEQRKSATDSQQIAQLDARINELQQQLSQINNNIQEMQKSSNNSQIVANTDEIQNKPILPINNQSKINLPGVNIQDNNIEIKNQESINDSFNLKQKQLDIINKSNPMLDDYHTGIRNVDDINTFEEAFFEDGEWSGFDPDFTEEMGREAVNTGRITIYSSYPIENGVFVSPSVLEASQYAGGDASKLYQKTVNINDVAWIDGAEGQYAPVQNKLPRVTKGNILINNELYQKYSNVENIFESERNNFNGEVKINSNIEEINNIDFNEIKPTDSAKFKKIAIEIFEKYNNKTSFINDGNKINVSRDGIRKSIDTIFKSKKQLNMLKEHLQVFSDLGDIIEHATLVNQANETKLNVPIRKEINYWNYYFDGLEIDGKIYNLEFDVRSLDSGENQYRVQRLELKDTKKVDYSTGAASNNTRNLPAFEQSTSYEDNTINLPKNQVVLPINSNMQKNQKDTNNLPLTKDNNVVKANLDEVKNIPKNPTKEESYEVEKKKTRKDIQNELLDEMGITINDLSSGKDISSIGFQRTDPIRLNEKVFGYEVGQKINDATINKTKHNEAERTRFLNQERDSIKELGIKARSKESAAVQKYAEKQYVNDKGEVVKYGDHQLAAEFPDVETQNKIKRAADVLRNKYDKYIDDINSTITEMGYDAIPKRTDYMKHFTELSDKLSQWGIPLNRNSLSEDSLPTDINGVTDQFKPGKNWFASAMQRKGIKTTYDAITGIDSYLEGASNLIYHTQDIQRYRALSKLIRETYGQTHGMDNIDVNTKEGQQRLNDIFDNKLSKYVAWLDEQANSLAGKKGAIDRGAERALGRKIYGILETAKKQVGSNMTGFNVRSALTNFASAVQGASKTNKLAFLKGTASTLQNIIHDDGLIDKSDFLTSRLRNGDQLSKKFWQKASNAGQIFMTGTDYFTANQIWRGKYYENLQNGMNESEAIKKADDFAARIMGDRSKGSTAEIFNSKTLGLLTQFQLEVNNQWSSIIHDNKMDLKSGNKSGATVMFQLGQLAALSFMFNNFMKSLTGSDVMIDPIDMLKKILGAGEDDEEKTLEQRATEVIGDLWDDLPFVSFLTGGRMPVGEAFNGIGTLAKYATGQTDNYGNKIKISDVKDDIIESAYYWLLPTGYGQLRKTTKGLSMYDKNLPIAGSYTDSGNLRFTADESTSGKIKAALFGQYSSEESQKYSDSGYKAISSSRVQELKDLGMTASEYRKYNTGLKNAGTTNAEKIDYIANSDYNNKQKNIMAKNVLKKDFDIKEYKKYSSYDEYDYATKYPDKYSVVSQISSFDNYTKWKNEIQEIKNNTTNDKVETIKYINSLNLSIPQKAMFIKLYYSSFNNYNKQIIEYVNEQSLSVDEKKQILEKLKFTIKDGKVYW